MSTRPRRAENSNSAPRNHPKLIKRLNMREIHSSRAALSIVVAVVVLAVIVWLGVELILSLTGSPALLMSAPTAAERMVHIATATIPGVLIAAGIMLGLGGIVLCCAAIVPGRKPRHIVMNPRAAVVVDSAVVAAAVSRTARTAARLPPEHVASSVSRKRIDIQVRPSAGRSVDVAGIREAIEAEVASYKLFKRPATTISGGPHQPGTTRTGGHQLSTKEQGRLSV